MSNAAANPYAAPTARVEDVGANTEAEAIRSAHITHEASIKSIGILYYLGGITMTLAALIGFSELPSGVIGLVLLLLGVGQLFAGWGVRMLRGWGRTVASVLSAIGLLGFPLGTLISGYILYLLYSKKGRTVFSPAYKDVIAATPHVRYRTSIVVWIFLVLLGLAVALAVLGPMLSR